ncbi:MAG: hypothetical protein FJ102_10770 [Deltaproteobacteria bacterium]|nr:hypothetical protein [Deltaproteobacteria bacterium]
MSSQYVRIADARVLGANQTSPREQVADLGAYRTLHVAVRVLRPGTATDANTTVVLEHAATNEEEAFLAINSTSVRVDTAAPNMVVYLEVPSFMRFVRWRSGNGNFAGGPMVVIDLVAKE